MRKSSRGLAAVATAELLLPQRQDFILNALCKQGCPTGACTVIRVWANILESDH